MYIYTMQKPTIDIDICKEGRVPKVRSIPWRTYLERPFYPWWWIAPYGHFSALSCHHVHDHRCRLDPIVVIASDIYIYKCNVVPRLWCRLSLASWMHIFHLIYRCFVSIYLYIRYIISPSKGSLYCFLWWYDETDELYIYIYTYIKTINTIKSNVVTWQFPSIYTVWHILSISLYISISISIER